MWLGAALGVMLEGISIWSGNGYIDTPTDPDVP